MNFRFGVAMMCVSLLPGCSQEFPQKPWSDIDADYLQVLEEQKDFDSRLEIARLNFSHNLIDEANSLLSELMKENSSDMEVKAWYAANNCKIAGRKGPWLMGIDKLYGVWGCLEDLQSALNAAPDNFTIQMIYINTNVEVNMFGSFDKASVLLGKLLAKIDDQPNLYDPFAQVAIYEAAVNIESLRNANSQLLSSYLEKIIDINASLESVERANKILTKLSES
ncbi:hypothetical protein [Nitrosomonas sp.]|uniref:hypothetical protein n=1 Tax=Nitrosomonas sp. TaxID=42353 RepID=UPI001DE54748|nr:hypothetical protein [Nitrosomonas sp.]MBX3617761.1 hypothetical protein [Nitrosomonas sp.]